MSNFDRRQSGFGAGSKTIFRLPDWGAIWQTPLMSDHFHWTKVRHLDENDLVVKSQIDDTFPKGFCIRVAYGCIAVAASLLVCSCTSLPNSGPTMGRIEKDIASDPAHQKIRVEDITPELLAAFEADDELVSDRLQGLNRGNIVAPSNTIRIGDELSISVFELGYALFGGSPSAESRDPNPTAGERRLAAQVDDNGNIRLPYIGKIHVANLIPEEVERIIASKMRGLSQSPQAHVVITESVANSAYISGAVVKPGRIRLTAVRERLLDVIALSGGPSTDPDDIEVRLVRGNKVASTRLSALHSDDDNNIALLPGDRLELIKRPRTFTVLGASDKVSQIPFGTGKLMLADAIARAGGASDSRANPRGVFLFRLIVKPDGTQQPHLYRINMMKAQNYFLAQRFAMHNGDLLYFSNSSTNLPTKLINVINQLTSPIVTARILTR